MNPLTRSTLLPVATAMLFSLSNGPAFSQGPGSCHCSGIDDFGFRQHHHSRLAVAVPELSGQDAAGAIQEVVGLLLADRNTDWSRVQINKLREHLVDLDQIMLKAEIDHHEIEGGLVVRATGDPRTVEALRRQVPSHVERMNGFRGWQATSAEEGDVMVVTITSTDDLETAILRGVGFFGFMASGVHRPHQLLAVSRGIEG